MDAHVMSTYYDQERIYNMNDTLKNLIEPGAVRKTTTRVLETKF